MVIRQGDVYWIDPGQPSGSGPGHRRPFVVVQNDALNRTRISTAIVCALTSNVRWAEARGNVLLEKREANLPKESVVNVSQLFTVDTADLKERIGRLPVERVRQIVEGINLLIRPRDVWAPG